MKKLSRRFKNLPMKNLSLTINRSAMHMCKGFFEIITMHSFNYSFTLTKGPLISGSKDFSASG